MTNRTALKNLCNAVANTFYPDSGAVELALMNAGINADQEATPNDKRLLMAALPLIYGYVESSRSEGGVSASVRENAIKQSLRSWCKVYGVDEAEALTTFVREIEDGSHLW